MSFKKTESSVMRKLSWMKPFLSKVVNLKIQKEFVKDNMNFFFHFFKMAVNISIEGSYRTSYKL